MRRALLEHCLKLDLTDTYALKVASQAAWCCQCNKMYLLAFLLLCGIRLKWRDIYNCSEVKDWEGERGGCLLGGRSSVTRQMHCQSCPRIVNWQLPYQKAVRKTQICGNARNRFRIGSTLMYKGSFWYVRQTFTKLQHTSIFSAHLLGFFDDLFHT